MHLVGKTIIACQNLGGDCTTAQLDISGGINVTGPSRLTDLSGDYIDMSGGKIDISGSRVEMNGGTSSMLLASGVNIEGGNNSNFTTTVGEVLISGAGGVRINSTNIVDISGVGVLIGVGATTLEPLRQIKLSDGSGAYIDMSGGKIDISGDDITLTGGPTSIILQSQNITLRSQPGHMAGAINIGDPDGLSVIDISGDIAKLAVTAFSCNTLAASGNINANAGLDVTGGLSIEAEAGAGHLGLTMQGSSSIAAGLGDFGDVTYDGLCGRLDLSGSVPANALKQLNFSNLKILSTSIFLVSLNTGGSLEAKNLNVTTVITPGSVDISFANVGGFVATFDQPTDQLHFMIINPST